MTKDFTFKEVCKFLKEDDANLIDLVDNFLGAAIVYSPIILGPQALPALGLLGVKGELTKLGKNLFEKAVAKEEADYLSRMKRMEMAYGLICYTAFFEAIDQLLTKNLRKKINLQKDDKYRLAEESTDEEQNLLESSRDGTLDESISFPHPVVTYEEQIKRLGQLYNHMANNFQIFIEKLEVKEESDEETGTQIRDMVKELPDCALKCFESQYIELARIYPDFCIWSRLHEYKTTQGKLKNISDYLKQHASMLTQSEKTIDVGFDRLQKTVLAIPDHFNAVESANIVKGLKLHYEARINDPIIEDKYEPKEGRPALNYPKISEAYIPQSYRILLHTTNDMHLEKEETWNSLDRKDDLGAFLLSYLSSPYSIETPLLIMGHPGSGKSLLTKVLCARLMSESYTPIRVPLREVNAELDFEDQISDEIKHATGNLISSWANFSGQFDQRPLVIVLDGYDELLQASGRIFAKYLTDVQKFQQREIEQGRPVRVIVTSRIALIDKATLPKESTVIRLLDFSEEQRKAWINIWNTTNKPYFDSCEPPIQLFEDPTEKKILVLAGQPLLLLMLAIYDSVDNSLKQNKRLDRTVLYNNLLRHFINREKSKDVEFDKNLSIKEQQIHIDKEMKRLGVAAIGMYNRRKLHIQSTELTSDLQFFNLGHSPAVQNGRPLTPADMLIGSFFFIHKSKAGQKSDGDDQIEGDTAFEFLHNTFGEFLTADFILGSVFRETEALHDMKQKESLRDVFQRKIEEPDGLANDWFVCLMYEPLYSRPVVLEMLRERTIHLLQKKGMSRKDLLDCLDEILQSQINMILDSKILPSMLRTKEATQFADLPLIGHVAIYTLNLIILRAVLDKNEFVFDETFYKSNEEMSDQNTFGARPWDKITHMWRSWFSLENLNGLTAIFTARRDDSKIIITARKTFQISPSGDRLETVLNVALVLADNITTGLAGLHFRDSGENECRSLAEMEKQLKTENIHMHLEFLVWRLRHFLSSEEDIGQGDKIVIDGLSHALEENRSALLISEFIHLVVKALQFNRLSIECEMKIYRRIIIISYFREMRSETVVELIRLAREVGADWWIERFFNTFLERLMEQPGYFREMRPETAFEVIRLAREIGADYWTRRFGKEFLKRLMEQPGYFGEMRPDTAVEVICLAQEVGAVRWARQFVDNFLELAVYSDYLREMRLETVVELIRLAQEVGADYWTKRFCEEFLERSVYSDYFREVRPETALELICLAREVGADSWTKRFCEEFLERAVNSDYFREVRPDTAVELIRLAQEAGADYRIKQFVDDFLKHVMRTDYLREMRPDTALELIRLAKEVGVDYRIERFVDDFLKRVMHSGHISEMRPDTAVELIRLVRGAGASRLIERLGEESFEHIICSSIGKMSLEHLQDIKWYAKITHKEILMRKILTFVDNQ